MHRHALLCLLVLLVSLDGTPVLAQSTASYPHEQADLRGLVNAPQPQRLRDTITTLVGFGTRHTLSDTRSTSRGIGAARRWIQSRFEATSRDCGGCLEIVTPSQAVTGKRIAQPTKVVDVIAIKRGSSDPQRVIVMTAHLDSRVSDVMDASHDAPGADDDASGVAAVMEAARLLSTHDNRATLVFAVLSGEEQGLYGGKVLADYAKAHGWQVEADLNNDIVGGSRGQNGASDNTHVRVFSEGTRSTETPAQAKARNYLGGEVDSPSRNVARYLATLADQYLPDLHVHMVYRTDRYGRGGDQVPFLENGYPAVRLTESHEDYTHQHQDLREEHGVKYGDTIDGIDFPYLARVTALNTIAMAALSRAPAPPAEVSVQGAVSTNTTLNWQKVPGAADYRAHWRDTTAPQWQYSRSAGDTDHIVLNDVVIDDWFFGVSAVSADGYESPVVFPGDAGSFAPAKPQSPAR